MKMDGVERLKAKLEQLKAKYGKEGRSTVVVGFTQRY